ncbi:hypothetical protein HHK36_029890 [Tetracentron sinense]|uniref:Sulfotransferase n=1 Tax=Tetracentron sinense TaxID=13715 RepID=A0A835CZR7_TETSI|nr:hypothetical protein HHK36_029890 [Tetracentron sinense]
MLFFFFNTLAIAYGDGRTLDMLEDNLRLPLMVALKMIAMNALRGGSLLVAEAVAVRRALKFAEDWGWRKVLVLSDALGLVESIGGTALAVHWEAQVVVDDILVVLALESEFRLLHTQDLPTLMLTYGHIYGIVTELLSDTKGFHKPTKIWNVQTGAVDFAVGEKFAVFTTNLFMELPSSIGGFAGMESSIAFESFCNGVHPFGSFHDHVLGYWKESLEKPQKILFLKYEELKKEPRAQMKKLASFLGKPFVKEEEVDKVLWRCSFDRLKNLEVNKNGVDPWVGMLHSSYFRLGNIGDWKNKLHDRYEGATRPNYSHETRGIWIRSRELIKFQALIFLICSTMV